MPLRMPEIKFSNRFDHTAWYTDPCIEEFDVSLTKIILNHNFADAFTVALTLGGR